MYLRLCPRREGLGVKEKLNLGQAVIVQAFYFDDPSSNPAKLEFLFCKLFGKCK